MVTLFLKNDLEKERVRQDNPEINDNFIQFNLFCKRKQMADELLLPQVDSCDTRCLTRCSCKYRAVKTCTRERKHSTPEGRINISEILTRKPPILIYIY